MLRCCLVEVIPQMLTTSSGGAKMIRRLISTRELVLSRRRRSDRGSGTGNFTLHQLEFLHGNFFGGLAVLLQPGPDLLVGSVNPGLATLGKDGPVLLEMIVVGLDAGDFPDNIDDGVHDDVREETPFESVSFVNGCLWELNDLRNEAVCDTVAVWDEHDGDERGNRIAGIIPVDGANLTNHQESRLPHVS